MGLHKIIALIDKTSDRLGRAISWLTLAMVLLMALIVALRYLFQYGSIAMQESIMYLNALIFTLGAGYTLKEQGHVRVDIFYNRHSEKGRALVNIAGALLFLFPSCIFIVYASWDYVSISWQIKEGSPESSGLDFVYLLKATIFVMAALLSFQGISELLKAIGQLKQGDGDEGN